MRCFNVTVFFYFFIPFNKYAVILLNTKKKKRMVRPYCAFNIFKLGHIRDGLLRFVFRAYILEQKYGALIDQE